MQLQHKMATNRAHQQQRAGMNPYGMMYQHQMQVSMSKLFEFSFMFDLQVLSVWFYLCNEI